MTAKSNTRDWPTSNVERNTSAGLVRLFFFFFFFAINRGGEV